MRIHEENMKIFMDEFKYKIFPTIQGSDGKGLDRLKAIVEKKRIEVAKRKLKNEVYNQIASIPYISNKEVLYKNDNYSSINLQKIDFKIKSTEKINEVPNDQFFNNQSAHIVSGGAIMSKINLEYKIA
ncbi:hypothetical protein [Terribacillus saccharophilus]|uniref:hypothetical protein n=1 Tax=Terribacillus saccharophilus TaxID=361277 RepID=UPI000C9C0043|nr:hypothetical protein [Terribacillus goriensis]